ncbi:RHS repeat-associated core domain-containing protein [Solimicrobium silvestre]|uniref:RHS repeat-associated core domain n=1 Tax=Solimicrobium silvestre TaxID=2099400 RepID=A0A2S9GSE1_9BURK|nr:RHS repeat-associated core domain [Solimicrobium silvestre]
MYGESASGSSLDAETNLHYNAYRDYDPTTGRYVESDPIGLTGGISTYGYVSGNPLASSDPQGLAPGYRICVMFMCPPELPGLPSWNNTDNLTPEQQAEKDADYLVYKEFQKYGRPPKQNDPNCDELKAQRDFWKQLATMRVDFTDVWYRGIYDFGHLLQVMIAQGKVNKIERQMKAMGCPCDK